MEQGGFMVSFRNRSQRSVPMPYIRNMSFNRKIHLMRTSMALYARTLNLTRDWFKWGFMIYRLIKK